MSLSSRPSVASEADDEQIDFWSSSSEEEVLPSEEDDDVPHAELIVQAQVDFYMPPELWVLVAGGSIELYRLYSLISKQHYDAFTAAWFLKVHRDITAYPVLRENENHRRYYQRIAKKTGVKLLPASGEFDFNEPWKGHYYSLLNAVMYDVEKLVERLISLIQESGVKLNQLQCERIFKNIGIYSRKRGEVLLFLLNLIKDMPGYEREAILRAGIFSFANNEKSVLHEGKVLSILLKEIALDDRGNKNEKVDAHNELRLLKQQMELIIGLCGRSNNLPFLDVSALETEKEFFSEMMLWFISIFGYMPSKNNAVIVTNAVSVLLAAMPEQKRYSLANQFLDMAIAFSSEGISVFTNQANLPVEFKSYLDMLQVVYDPEEILNQVDAIKLIAKALYVYLSVFNVEDSSKKIASLSFSAIAGNYAERCFMLAVAGNVELEKIKLIFDLVPKETQVRAVAGALLLVMDAAKKRIVKLDSLFLLLKDAGLTIPVMEYFLQEDLRVAPIIVRYIKKFSSNHWRQAFDEIIMRMLDAQKKNNELFEFFVAYKDCSLINDVLIGIFKNLVCEKNNEKASLLMERIPYYEYFALPVITFLHRSIDEAVNVAAAFDVFQSSYVKTRVVEIVVRNLAAYDSENDASTLRHFSLFCALSSIDVARALYNEKNSNIRQFIWSVFDNKAKISILVCVFNDLLNTDCPSSYDDFVELFNRLPRSDQDDILKRVLALCVLLMKENNIHVVTDFYLQIGVSVRRLVTLSAQVLFDLLKERAWKMGEVKYLLSSFLRGNTEKYLDWIVLKALVLSVQERKNHAIIALVNLPVAWKFIDADAMNELVSLVDGLAFLSEDDKVFLTASISPEKLIERKEQVVMALPSQGGLFKVTPNAQSIDDVDCFVANSATCFPG